MDTQMPEGHDNYDTSGLQLSDPVPVVGMDDTSYNIAPTNASEMSPKDKMTKAGLGILQDLNAGISSYMEGNEQAMLGKFRAGEYMRGAQMQSLRTKELWNQESFDEQRMSERNAQQIGGEVAAQAGQGINVRSEGAQSVTNATASIGAKDILTIRNNAYAKAFGYNMEAIQDKGEATVQEIKANFEKKAGFYDMLTGFASDGMKVEGVKS
jgi:hypothetical protein